MAFETVAIFAHATGRTLVMPPKQRVYLLKLKHDGNPKAYHGLDAFMNLDVLKKRLEIIDTIEFVQRLQLGPRATKLARAAESGDPGPRRHLREWLREEADLMPRWDPMRELLVFGGGNSTETMTTSTDQPWRPLSPVDLATSKRRIRFIDEATLKLPWIHFASNNSAGYRMFTHWYTFFLFLDGPTDHYYKRFARDFLRYTDDVFCAAGTVVNRISSTRKKKKKFSAVHIRRGELQYTKVRITAEAWVDALTQWLIPGETLFVLSDERDPNFFQPLRQAGYNLIFLDDVLPIDLRRSLDPNKLGQVEQLIAASPYTRTFTGTWFSTFSSYVARLRAYYGGHPPDTVYYAAPKEKQFVMHDPLRSHFPEFPFYTREWAIAWDKISPHEMMNSSHHSRDRTPLLTELPLRLPYDDLPLPKRPTAKRPVPPNRPGV